jgi:hypothetical protein
MNENEYLDKYFMSARECAIEELWADHDILVDNREGWCWYYVPKNKPDLFQWIIDNSQEIKHKVMQRASINPKYVSKTDWQRVDSAEQTAKFFSKIHK